MINEILFGSIWIISGILHYGLDLAYWQRKYPSLAKDEYVSDVTTSLLSSLAGCISLITLLLFRQVGYGIMFRRNLNLRSKNG